MSLRAAAPRAGVAGNKERNAQQEAQRFLAVLARFQPTLNGEPPYLDAGPGSRLALSLRCGIAEEQDFALERLLHASEFDPELLPVHHHFSLLEALFDVIETELERRKDMLQLHPWANSFRAEWPSAHTRRATEAALVLRNLATYDKNVSWLEQNYGRRIRKIIIEALKLALPVEDGIWQPPAPSDGDGLDELKLYMLEILQVSSAFMRLLPPALPEERTDAHMAEREMLPVLTALSYSPDRAIVIASLSILADLARVDAHEPLFSSPTATSTTYSPLARALELLPLQDAEINAAALAYLYAVTNCMQVSIELTKGLHFLSVLRHLLLSISRGGQLEIFEAEACQSMQTPKGPQKGRPVEEKPGTTSLRLKPEALSQILHLPEPQRLKHWMQMVYEAQPNAETSQVDLWKTYAEEFKPHDHQYKMLQPADVIKHTNDAFPGATPMVISGEQKRFIIRGIRPRSRNDLGHTFRCQWSGCSLPQDPARTTAAALYDHLKSAHIVSAVQEGGRCNFAGCRYVLPPLQTAGGQEHADLVANALALHLRTHIPTSTTSAKSPASVIGKDTVPLDVLHTERADDGTPIGRGFLAAFALRNIARAIRTGMAHDHNDRTTGGAQSLVSAIAGDGANADQDSAPVRMSPSYAKKASESLLTLEVELTSLLAHCPELSAPLGEILDVLHLAHIAVSRKANQMHVG